jgi:hypothetical protein
MEYVIALFRSKKLHKATGVIKVCEKMLGFEKESSFVDKKIQSIFKNHMDI